ncbi:Magnetosome protein MamN [Gammaproteobacteria bacterium]
MTAALWSVSLFALVFFLTEAERVDRNQAMVGGAILMLFLGWFFDFYTLQAALKAVYFDTLALIFGMSLVGNVLVRSGVFTVLATKVANYSRGNAQLVLVLLVLTTYSFSLVVNNLATMLIMLPLTLAICSSLKLKPVAIVAAELVASNLGGASTLTGDFPNMIIGAAGKLHFDDFIGSMMVPCLMLLAVTLGYFGKRVVRLSNGVATTGKSIFESSESVEIDYYLLRVGLTVLGVMLFALVFSYPLGLQSGSVALVAGAVLLIFGRVPQGALLKAMSGDDILFFAALFILVGGLQSAGVLSGLHDLIVALGARNATQSSLVLMLISALLTPFLNAGPTTALIVPVASVLSREFPGSPVWWALSLGVLAGSSATLSGATAGPVVSSQMSYQSGGKPDSGWVLDSRTYRQWGIPIASTFLVFSMLYIVVWVR